MSNIESDEHYRVKPDYNGTAGDQIFFPRSSKVPFTRDCKIFQQRTRLRYGQVQFTLNAELIPICYLLALLELTIFSTLAG